jgi:Na+-translocating ferredoxin:NAD+ oxidoreductase RnfG subunit
MGKMKKFLFTVLAVAMAVSLMASQDDAVKSLLPDSDLKPAIFTLSAADMAAVQAALGNQMPVRAEYQLYVSKTGVVVIEEQMGKWGPIKMAILIDPVAKTVQKIEIISMSEKRGAGITQGNFLGQFYGKTAADIKGIGDGIRAISGATVSSKAVLIAAKRALVVYGLYSAAKKGK